MIIRKRLTEDEDTENFTQDEMKNTRAFKYWSRACEKAGYYLRDLYLEKFGRRIRLSILIVPNAPYAPQIYTKNGRLNELEFVAQTTAFGALNVDQYEEFANQIYKTQALLDDLQTFDWINSDVAFITEDV